MDYVYDVYISKDEKMHIEKRKVIFKDEKKYLLKRGRKQYLLGVWTCDVFDIMTSKGKSKMQAIINNHQLGVHYYFIGKQSDILFDFLKAEESFLKMLSRKKINELLKEKEVVEKNIDRIKERLDSLEK